MILITRHPALQQLLESKGFKITKVVTHISEVETLEGQDVIGNLPLDLAAYANSITSVTLVVPEELRGKELTIDQLNQFYRGYKTFVVIHSHSVAHAGYLQNQIATL